jgi:Family of unknown function (DUF6312)
MADESEPTKKAAHKAPPVASEPQRVEASAGAFVVDVKKKKRKKRKYSRGLKDVQRAGRRVSKANRRIARAVASGFAEFYRKSDRSSRKRRDGLIRDFNVNLSKGLSKSLRRSSWTPVDFAEAFDTKSMRRTTKQVARLFALPFFR